MSRPFAPGLLALIAVVACATASPPAGERPGRGAPSDPDLPTSARPTRPPPPDPRERAVGVSWPSFRPDAYDQPAPHLRRIRRAGFGLVTLVPTYAYVGLNRIDRDVAPSVQAQSEAVATALRLGLAVVVKPHLDPPLYLPGRDPLQTRNPSWRAHCPWRGYFDVNPMSEAYLQGVMLPTLDAVERALEGTDDIAEPVRLELGSELMNSTVHQPERWAELLSTMRSELRARGLEGRVLLSHNFSHHALIPQDLVLRMDDAERNVLARYVRGLDAVAVSQYMDLTAAMPEQARDERMPTVEEVAEALVHHERTFRRTILQRHLGLAPPELPPIHIGEFGIGIGGLAHPNLWQGELTGAEREELRRATVRGHAGLLAYLDRQDSSVHGAVLWVTGGTYDIFGWMDQASRIPEAAELYERRLGRPNDPDPSP